MHRTPNTQPELVFVLPEVLRYGGACRERIAVDAECLDEAVADGYLVPPKGVSIGTKFLRQGIRYDDLTEAEKKAAEMQNDERAQLPRTSGGSAPPDQQERRDDEEDQFRYPRGKRAAPAGQGNTGA